MDKAIVLGIQAIFLSAAVIGAVVGINCLHIAPESAWVCFFFAGCCAVQAIGFARLIYLEAKFRVRA